MTSAPYSMQLLHLCISGSEEPRVETPELRSKVGRLQRVLADLPALAELWAFPSSDHRGVPAWAAPTSKRWPLTRQLLAYFEEQTPVRVRVYHSFEDCILDASDRIAGLRHELCLP